jgi:hypothetical protein
MHAEKQARKFELLKGFTPYLVSGEAWLAGLNKLINHAKIDLTDVLLRNQMQIEFQ